MCFYEHLTFFFCLVRRQNFNSYDRVCAGRQGIDFQLQKSEGRHPFRGDMSSGNVK
jgi:hypothetical protein